MLTPEEAKTRLDAWRADSTDKIAERIQQLPPPLQAIASEFTKRSSILYGFILQSRDEASAAEKTLRRLEELGKRDRQRVWTALTGELAPVVETAWQYLKGSTYPMGYARRSFRAPHEPSATFSARINWLMGFVKILAQFQPEAVTVPWLAAWSPHLGFQVDQDGVGRLLAAVIDAGGPLADETFDILVRSTANEHEIGAMGRHVSRALLMASRPEGWELMERTLLAAQRQEGLRQVILETVDEAHPEAFRRMLRLIREHDLVRFSATVRAVCVWFGMVSDSANAKEVNATIERVLSLLDDAAACEKALSDGDPLSARLALWSVAYADAIASIPLAAKLLEAKDAKLRFVAALHLSQLALPQTRAALCRALDDEELSVAAMGLRGLIDADLDPHWQENGEGVFERLQRLLPRFPRKPQKLNPLECPWAEWTISQATVSMVMIQALGDRPATALIPYLSALSSHHRAQAVQMLADQGPWGGETRAAMLELAGDAVADVRAAAGKALIDAQPKFTAEEIAKLERYLTRKAADLRQAVLALLLQQTDAAALASADRLLAAKDPLQRLAGLEVLRQLAAKDRRRADCRQRVDAYRTTRKKLSAEEQAQIDGVAGAEDRPPTLADALGLMDPAERSPAVAPQARKVQFVTKAAVACIQSLDALIDAHRETPLRLPSRWRLDESEELLGGILYGFPRPDWSQPAEKNKADLPLAELWEDWFTSRPKALRDKDGLELLRASMWLDLTASSWSWGQIEQWSQDSDERKQCVAKLSGGFDPLRLKYPHLVDRITSWMTCLHPPEDAFDFLLDATETAFTLIPGADLRKKAEPREPVSFFDRGLNDWRKIELFSTWYSQLNCAALRNGAPRAPSQLTRWWQLLRWRDEPFAGAARGGINFSYVARAYEQGLATRADLLDNLFNSAQGSQYGLVSFDSLGALTQPKLSREIKDLFARRPEVREIVEQCRARIVEIELARGESPTAATLPAWSLASLAGVDRLLRILTALGQAGFKVPAGWQKTGLQTKVCTLTHLASVTYPKADDTPEEFRRVLREAVADGRVSEKQVLELAFLAPQWAQHVEHYLGWKGFAEALYWFLAHMRFADGRDEAARAAGVSEPSADSEKDEDPVEHADGAEKSTPWQRLIAERTPLSDEERLAGAVDVGWFQRTYAQLTSKRWQAMAEAARFAANAAQARHAQFVADVLRGKASRRQLIAGVRQKKLKDYVRLLGLLPLAKGAKRQPDLIERYNVLQEYRRYARDLSAMTKPEALRSFEVGLQNLARTAGYADPLRLEWAMEAEQVKDLAAGPRVASKDGVTVRLALDAEAQPQLSFERGGKPLRSAPAAVKKDKRIAALLEQATHLKRQAARMKASLEAAMCRGDQFTGEELTQLCRHPILAPALARLVLVGEGILGYPDRAGKALRDAAGKLEPVKKSELLRVAHPHDLLVGGMWSEYQRECFQAERVQPFKQVFRELYVVTAQEQSDGIISRRYAGQQIQPQQAVALWGQRGWGVQDGVWKTYHDVGITASVGFAAGFGTPLEVEGLTIDGVEFHQRDGIERMRLGDVPPRLFSEVMRDMDLVVSVAHRGGVDPEASASTVEMRASLLRETCALLGLENVRIKEPHVLVDGEIGNYSVHLGSATVHRMPGGAICLVAVPAAHRGRLFLPFADDDPRTAEVIAKTILLARDREIQDPAILEQLRR